MYFFDFVADFLEEDDLRVEDLLIDTYLAFPELACFSGFCPIRENYLNSNLT